LNLSLGAYWFPLEIWVFLQEERLLSLEIKMFLKKASMIPLEAEMYQRKESVARVKEHWFPCESSGNPLKCIKHYVEAGQEEGRACVYINVVALRLACVLSSAGG
jgi:hypothetical protein